MPVNFFVDNIIFQLAEKRKHKNWIKEIIERHNHKAGDINYIFSNDEYLLHINQQYLNHDYYTDIITFDQSEEEGVISGDIYISIERVKENAFQHHHDFQKELNRVMVHGILHLLGFNDHSPEEKKVMREKEEASLSLYPD